MESNNCCKAEKISRKYYKVKSMSKAPTAGSDAISSQNTPVGKMCGCDGKNQSPCESVTSMREQWITGNMETVIGVVPCVSTKLTLSDTWGTCKVRFGLNRMNYKVSPGLYAVGKPEHTSPVLVTANYKLTFDALRKELDGLDAWIIVIDTKGVNVWCAAGKGTFGIDEIVKRISLVNLSRIVSHRTLILPQLGAPGVSAHEVTKRSV